MDAAGLYAMDKFDEALFNKDFDVALNWLDRLGELAPEEYPMAKTRYYSRLHGRI